MDKAEFFDMIKQNGICAVESEFEDYIWEQRKAAAAEQQRKDIIAALVALCDAGIKDEQKLYDLLYEYFYIDSRTEADSYIKIAKTVNYPLKELRRYLKQEGYSSWEVRTFLEENQAKERLESNTKLHQMPIHELKKYLEEN